MNASGTARGLGWFGVGLGLTGMAAPRRLGRLLGLEDRRRGVTVALAGAAGVAALKVADAVRAAEDRTGRRIDTFGTVVVDRRADELHRLFQQPETIGRLIPGVATATADGHVSCTFRTLTGKRYGWDGVFLESRPGESATWGPAPGSKIKSGGSVAFAPAAGGTEVALRLWVEPPSALRDPLALLLPLAVNDKMIATALRRFAAIAMGNTP